MKDNDVVIDEQGLTITDLIEKLVDFRELHGDLPVWILDSAYGELQLFADEVEVLLETEDKPTRLSL
jgi:hypothetical protein